MIVFSDPENHFCSGCLDVTYRFANDNSSLAVNRIEVLSFCPTACIFGVTNRFMVDVGWNTVSMGVIPTEVASIILGSDIVFLFTGSNQILPGETTVQLDIQTNSTAWDSNGLVIFDGAGFSAGAFSTFEPPIIPEPSSLALLGAGLLPVIGVIRRSYLNR